MDKPVHEDPADPPGGELLIRKPRRILWRPWAWPWFLFGRLVRPVPPGLWLINVFTQRILRVNGEYPWMIHFTSRVTGDVRIGCNVWKSFAVSGGCYIQGGNGIVIGPDTIFAPGVKIVSANHDVEDPSAWTQEDPIRIGARCWIGANAVILPGVELGEDVVVGAGAVVTKSFPAGSVVAGVPARVIRTKPDFPG
ncbi:MAG: acyltransferase [Kiritimatiellae bacterium]|nr:acyltransferase [Kiritimatiellia bacterium]